MSKAKNWVQSFTIQSSVSRSPAIQASLERRKSSSLRTAVTGQNLLPKLTVQGLQLAIRYKLANNNSLVQETSVPIVMDTATSSQHQCVRSRPATSLIVPSCMTVTPELKNTPQNPQPRTRMCITCSAELSSMHIATHACMADYQHQVAWMYEVTLLACLKIYCYA